MNEQEEDDHDRDTTQRPSSGTTPPAIDRSGEQNEGVENAQNDNRVTGDDASRTNLENNNDVAQTTTIVEETEEGEEIQDDSLPPNVYRIAQRFWRSVLNNYRVIVSRNTMLSSSHMSRIIRDLRPIIQQTQGACTDFVWSLDLGHNTFTEIPNGLQWFHRVERLDLSSNLIESLTTLPSSPLKHGDHSSSSSSTLKSDSVDDRESENDLINKVSGVLCRMTMLKILNLSTNRLKEIETPRPSIGAFTWPHQYQYLFPESLRVLDLQNNQIVKISDDAFSNLKQLARLSLAYNQLQTLPSSICDLSQLLELELNDNQLTFLPQRMQRLNKLNVLTLMRNSFHLHKPMDIRENITVENPLSLQELCRRYIRRNRIHSGKSLTDIVPSSVMEVEEDIQLENKLCFQSLKRQEKLEQEVAVCPLCGYEFSIKFTTTVISRGRVLSPTVQKELVPIKWRCCSFNCAVIMLRRSLQNPR